MAGTNSRGPYLPQAPEDDEWAEQERAALQEMEKNYLESVWKQQPGVSGALRELRRQYDAGDITAEEYRARRLEVRRKELGWL